MEDRSWQVFAVAVLFFLLSWIAVALRVYCRGWIVRSFGVDDKLTIGLLSQLIYTVYLITLIQGVRYGTGRHTIDLSPQDNRNALMCWYICELLYIISTCLLKISVGYFLLRVSVRRAHVWVIRLLTLGTIFFGTALFFMVMFQCTPIPTFWEESPRAADKCLGNRVIFAMTYAASIINCLADWAFGILPLFILWSLSLPKRTQLLAFAVLFLAAIGSVATVVQSVYIPTLLDGDDFLWSTTDVALWSTVEVGIGIMAASIANLHPLWELISHRSGLSPRSPQSTAWRERFHAKPSYVRSDGSDPRRDPLEPIPNSASPGGDGAEARSVFQSELPPIHVSRNRFSLSTSSHRSRRSKHFEMAPPTEDKRSEGNRRSAENAPRDDVESLVTSREDSDGGQWLSPSPPRDTDEDCDFETEEGFNLTLMSLTHEAPTINWSTPRMSTISMGFGLSDCDSACSAAPSWSYSRCNGTIRVSQISGSALNHSNSSRTSRRSNIMHSSSIRANSSRANSIRANSIRANSTRAGRLSSISNANETRDDRSDAGGSAGSQAAGRDPPPNPYASRHDRQGRQGRTPPRASSHYTRGSQFLAPPSVDFQLPTPPSSVWRGSSATVGDSTSSAQWLSSRMTEHPEYTDPSRQ
ncbi:integral membrane protein [Colletotrichum somersetense]|nr:integral membrane protein [Colletotrichum somersetense]